MCSSEDCSKIAKFWANTTSLNDDLIILVEASEKSTSIITTEVSRRGTTEKVHQVRSNMKVLQTGHAPIARSNSSETHSIVEKPIMATHRCLCESSWPETKP